MLSLKNPKLWRYLIISVLSFVLAFLLMHKTLSDSLKTLQNIGCVLVFVIGIVALVFALRILLTIVLWLTLKRFNALFAPQLFTFTKEGMKIENAYGGSVAKAWKEFSGWKRTRSGYILRLFPSGVITIKRRDIATEKVVRFEALLEDNLGR
ncbi:MAG: YcxB family protein [Dehalococcoidia bacterium]|nr:YcxB family protein [Dehalococcoidia bacterium]